MANIQNVRRLGNSLLAVFDDGSTLTLARTNNHLWIPSLAAGGDGPGPGPGTGDFIWPFIALPSPDGDMPPVGHADEADAEFGPRVLTGNFHEGMDFGWNHAVSGMPIVCAGDGVVAHNGSEGNWGISFVVNHGEIGGKTLFTRYAHRQAVAGPAVGQPVSKGDIIGAVGSTGNVFGPHLHWETHITDDGVMVNNISDPGAFRTAVDPRTFMATYGE